MSVFSEFRRTVDDHGDVLAVVANGRQWTYQALNQLVTQAAAALVTHGVVPNTMVVFIGERSIDALVLQLAILAVGGIYVPLDPAGPSARWSQMLQLLGTPSVVAGNQELDALAVAMRLPLVTVPGVDSDDMSDGMSGMTDALSEATREAVQEAVHDALLDGVLRSPDDAAYVMFTSGSTGVPKGVLVPHRGIVRLVCNVDYVALGPGRTTLHAAPLAFDAATFEIWGALLTGGCCVVHDERLPSAVGLGEAIREYGVTTLWLTAGLFNAIIDEDPEQLAGVDELLIGGEALSVPHVLRALRALPGTTLINGYGPTETTTFAATFRIPRPLPHDVTAIPIGFALPETTLAVCDEVGVLVPDGTEGELIIGGAGVAIGYLGEVDQSPGSSGFLADPSAPGQVWYRTGDRVRRRADGALEFLGRSDGQIKISGHRIEPAEIERILCSHPGVESAAVVLSPARAGAAPRLVAFVVDHGRADDSDDAILASLKGQLPNIMVPHELRFVEKLPLTSNGKIDRYALRALLSGARVYSLAVPESFPQRGLSAGDAEAESPHASVTNYEEAVGPTATRSALAWPTNAWPTTDSSASAPSKSARLVTDLLCDLWTDLLGVPVRDTDNIFDLGASSLLVIRAVARLTARDSVSLPAIAFFEYPSPRALAESVADGPNGAGALGGMEEARAEDMASTRSGEYAGVAERRDRDTAERGIAIVGASVRLPGASTVAEYWERLLQREDTISHFTPDALDPEALAGQSPSATYVSARGVLEGVEQFDAEFFGINPREAQLTDPQQRLWLELGWEALEDAALIAERSNVVTGVFGGVYNSHYLARALALQPELVARYGGFNAMLLNEKDYVAPRVAHRLGLRGPAISVHTACSTSLVAVAQAVQALRDGSCDLALAGGVALTLPSRSGYEYQEGSMLSPDGRTRPFDVNSAGTVFSDGAAVVVLKRLDDAIADGDQIYSVIRGVAVNNDGGNRASFSAPSVAGQAAVVRKALDDAGIDARAVSYVEAHGTATPLGDPIEVDALRRVFSEDGVAVGACRLGSVKGHLGHTVIAAGAAGLLKAALALRNELVPGTAHYTEPNPALALESAPFRVTSRPEPWLRSTVPRFAGVSSFGVGGTNAHVILEEPPLLATRVDFGRYASDHAQQAEMSVWPHVFPLSARSETALAASAAQLGSALESIPEQSLPNVAETLLTGREWFAHRRVVVADHGASVRRALRDATSELTVHGVALGDTPDVVFQFPGQGAQRVGMARWLYLNAPVFRQSFDACAEVAAHESQFDLRRAIDEGNVITLSRTDVAQPALFATAYSLAKLWHSLGVHPSAMLGHSVGEFVAAALANVLAPEDAMRLVCARGRLMQALPPGRMLAVALAEAELRDRLPDALSLAAVNAPTQCVVSGPQEAIAEFQRQLEADGLLARPLATSHAFHSAMMDPILAEFGELVRSIPLRPPTGRIVSTVTGDTLDAHTAIDPNYWTRHLRETVRYSDAITTLLADRPTLFLESGPASTLTTLVRRQGRATPVRSVASLDLERPDREQITVAAAQLWCWGTQAAWPLLDNVLAGRPRRISLPTYPFERTRCWVDPLPAPPGQLRSIPGAPTPVAPTAPVVTPNAPVVTPNETTHAVDDQLAAVEAVTAATMSTESSAPINRRATLESDVLGLVAEISGLSTSEVDPSVRFSQLGLDSLVLTQLALGLSRRFGVRVAFRQLLESLSSASEVAAYLHEKLAPPPNEGVAAEMIPGAAPVATSAGQAAAVQATSVIASSVNAAAVQAVSDQSGELPAVGRSRGVYDASRAFGAAMRVTVADRNPELSPRQRARLDAFIRRYTDRTAGSKRYTAEHRDGMADPRAATGFRPLTKELVYPIVVERSDGARLWDVDGNEYIDVLSGFGSNLLGWRPQVVTDALRAQLDLGFEVGPQHALAGEVAERLREMLGVERVAFCNTGSEAVLGAMRIARTVTGRPLVVIFTGSYHGINDDVIVRPRRDGVALPAAPGIMPEATSNTLVLEYGAPESLAVLEARADDIAAVIVEPVQSRRPDFQPREFLAALRELTTRKGIVYVWDEIVTGFRAAPGGAQEHFGIQGDLGTYGKIIGGGLPIGVIAGRREFMDALDGGPWRYNDASVPEVGVTYFAGTFVRHPLALAAALAMVTELARQGPSLQAGLADRTSRLAEAINLRASELGVALEVRHFTSVWKTFFTADAPHSDLFFYALRERGVHIYDGFPCFLTAAHGDAECAAIVDAFAGAMEEMLEGRFLPLVETAVSTAEVITTSTRVPQRAPTFVGGHG